MQKYAHIVELEKCCQTHIFLQNLVLIQPRTSPLKFCKICKSFQNFSLGISSPASPTARGTLTAVPLSLCRSTQVANFWQKFGKISLVFGCIGADLCKKIRVLQHFSRSTRLSSWNFCNFANFCKFYDMICKILLNSHENCCFFKPNFLRNFCDCSGAKVCTSCRAWKMLSNAYFLAKFRFDTAENEPAKNLQNFASFANPNP